MCERKALLQGAMDIRVCRNFYSSPVTPARPQLKCRGGCLGAEMAIKVLVRCNTVAMVYGNRVLRASGARDRACVPTFVLVGASPTNNSKTGAKTK